jgi:hypothetical protein
LPAILPEAVHRAEEQFSGWKLEYIVAENLFIYPRLDILLDRFRGQPRRISASELDSLLADILLTVGDDPTSPDWLRAELEPSKLLDLLYRLEVIGIEKPAGGGYDFVFSRPKGKPEQSPSFQFHPGLWQALELL